jgi:hypothetical protein
MIVRRSIVKGNFEGKQGSSFSEEKEAKRLLEFWPRLGDGGGAEL